LSCPHPGALLDHVNQTGRVSRRKFFLAAASCVRRVWHLLARPESRAAVQAAERYADGEIGQKELLTFRDPAAEAFRQFPEGTARSWAALAASWLNHDVRQNHGNAEHTMNAPDDVSRALASLTGAPVGAEEWFAARESEMRVQADLYRCVVGNPFRQILFSPAWQIPTVVRLGNAIYADRDFDLLPILADALEEAGCDNEDILAHCRGPGPHVRGCWVIDLVLEKGG
jgi:hypothetical protein